MRNLKDMVVLITGASRGIGAATATVMSKYGAIVVLAARSRHDIENNVQKIESSGGRASSIICDVSNYQDVKKAIDFCIEKYGRLDVLVNNAGTIDPISKLSESCPEKWSQAVDINLKGVYYGIRCAIPVMIKQGKGTIINISSGAANSTLEGWSHYCSTKAAAKKLTECAHNEVYHQGIRVIGLRPGTVATDMMSKIKDSGVNKVSRLDWSVHITPEWAGEAVAFLCTSGGDPFVGTDFSIKTEEGRKLVGLEKCTKS